ncbi:hypothetical protein R1sor_005581 [Riccia sorocarpa]|uniref:Tail fiber assembly protein n=1 Tax=Riccia sorocarpa TaxID=122646 RepID=A0ABD3HNU5_9MARC
MCCFCPSCIDEDWENCSNLEYTGPWTLHNVHPRKPADVVDYVDAIGHGQGIPDQSDEGTVVDLVEVDDFFAVEAEWPNDYSAEFWILQCTKPLHVLADTTTDAYAEARAEAEKVLADARAVADNILSSAQTEAVVITTGSSATADSKQQRRREWDANRKQMQYWEGRSVDMSSDQP